MITIEKQKPAKRELKLFSVEVALTPDAKDHVQVKGNIKGHRAEMMAFLDGMGVKPEEYKAIIKHAAQATIKDFVQQVVNLSVTLEGAEVEETED